MCSSYLGLLEYLGSNLDTPISRLALSDVLGFDPGTRPDARTEWQRFHLMGASLRFVARAP